MGAKRNLRKAETTSPRPSQSSTAVGSTDVDPISEVGSLARELSRAYVEMAAFYREQMKLPAVEAEAKARGAEPDADLEWDRHLALDVPPDQVSWWALTRLAERDPGAVARAWERIKAAARDELATGHRTARALEWGNKPWDRARFLAIRDAFHDEWRARGAIEAALVDVLAQSFTAYLDWTERLTAQAEAEGQIEDLKLKQEGYWQPPRIGVAEAMERSAAMAERAHRTFLRTLRALQDLRRLQPAVYVGTAGQVNIGNQQLNVSAIATHDEPAER